tara:strand:+ start:541 stop:654 length:114 start_codon:yes stop_codon:yes gene_type:complete
MKDLAILLVAIGFTFVQIVGISILAYIAYNAMREWND